MATPKVNSTDAIKRPASQASFSDVLKHKASQSTERPLKTAQASSVQSVSTANVGKIKIYSGKSHVIVDTGSSTLTPQEQKMFSKAYSEFIQKNNGVDLSEYKAPINSSNPKDKRLVSVASQFIGYNLANDGKASWFEKNEQGGKEEFRITAGPGKDRYVRLSGDTAGALVPTTYYSRDKNGALKSKDITYQMTLNMDWKDHRSNPSSLARTMIHEYLHKDNKEVRASQKHIQLDNHAKELLYKYGLGAGGCPSVGGIWPFIAPPFKGCKK